MDTYYCYVYALVDPRTEQVRYIGIARRKRKNGHIARFYRHLDEAKETPNKTHKTRWISCLLREKVQPTLIVLDEFVNISRQELCDIEKKHIAEHLALGFDLTNTTDGGDGGRGPLSAEEKMIYVARLVKANTGAKRSEASRERMREAYYRRDPTERAETLQKMNAARGPVSQETRDKIAKLHTGAKRSEETKQRMREAALTREQRKREARDIGETKDG